MLGIAALLTALSACSSGSSDAAIAELAISPMAPEVAPGDVVQFTAGPSTSGLITWVVAQADGGTIDGSGLYTAPEREGTFTVTAASTSDRWSTPVLVKRDVSLPVISSYTASPSDVGQGGFATLSWSVSGATSISIDNGVGAITGGSSKSVTPSATTTYTLTATNRAGSVTATAVVTVSAAPPPPPPASSQGTGTTYKPSTLTGVTGGGAMPSWTANVVTASCAGDGVTDDTACLQAAANTARSQNRPLVIPTKPSFYRITGPITVYTSVGGVGGMPTITQTNASATYGAQKMILLGAGMTGWIYNLHLVGTFNGGNAVTEHGHQIDVGNVNGVTISGNLLENAMGDSVSTDISQYDGGSVSQNVIVDGNTMRNPYRCAVAFVHNAQSWVVMNNLIEKPVNFVSGVDFEPEGGGTTQNVEVAYNRFVMNNRTVNPSRGADGMALSGWRPDATPSPGGNYYLHHNYGTFGTGFGSFGNGGWGAISQSANVEGSSIPN